MASDPVGQRYHVYRVERSLMSTQMGILNNAMAANGLIPIGKRPYANFDCDDPLGPVPLSGTPKYARWVAAAIEHEVRNHLLGEALEAWEAETGPPPPEAVAWADEVFAEVEELQRALAQEKIDRLAS